MSIEITTKIDTFFARYKLREYAKGQILLLSGDEASQVYYIVSGRVKLYDVSAKGDEVILNSFRPSAVFPISLIINPEPSPYIYEAESAVQTWQAPAAAMLAFLTDNPDALLYLVSKMYRSVDSLLGRMNQLMSGTARSRLLYELITEGKRYGIKQSIGCMLEITEKDIAARAGLSRETVSRELHKLKREEVVSVQGSHIVIPSIEKLEEKLDKNL